MNCSSYSCIYRYMHARDYSRCLHQCQLCRDMLITYICTLSREALQLFGTLSLQLAMELLQCLGAPPSCQRKLQAQTVGFSGLVFVGLKSHGLGFRV